jgi:hypothetical protein
VNEGRAEIAADHVRDVDDELLRQWAVEPELCANQGVVAGIAWIGDEYRQAVDQ